MVHVASCSGLLNGSHSSQFSHIGKPGNKGCVCGALCSSKCPLGQTDRLSLVTLVRHELWTVFSYFSSS